MSHNIESLHNDFIEELEIGLGRSAKTVENYDRYLLAFFNQQEIKKISDITQDTVRAFRRYLSQRGEGASLATQNYYLIAIRQFLKYLAKRDIEALSPEKIQLAKLPDRDIDVLYPEEVDRLLAATPPTKKKLAALRDRTLLNVLFSSGMRISEAIRLNRDDLRPHSNEITVRGKGNKVRVVFLSDEAKAMLEEYLEARADIDPALFVRHRTSRKATPGKVKPGEDNLRLTPRSVQRMIKRYAAAAGITKNVTPHTLRHCLHKDTRIILNPEILSAKTVFINEKPSVLSFDFTKNRIAKGKIIRHFSHKSTPLVQIWASGRELVCSPEHTLFTVTATGVTPIRADELKPGMYVAGAKSIKYRGKKAYSPDFWRLVGYIIGDGTLSESRHGIIISEKDRRFVDFYARLIRKVTGKDPTITRLQNRNSFAINIYNVRFLRQLRGLGITQKSPDRRLPMSLLKSTPEEIGACIAGLYDAEGNSGNLKIFSTSKDLLKDVQLALLRLEIDSFINERNRKVRLPQGKIIKDTIYILHVLQKPSQEQFQSLIPTLKTFNILPRNVDWKLPTQEVFRQHYRKAKSRNLPIGTEGVRKYGIKHLARYQTLCTTPKILQKIVRGFLIQGVEEEVVNALQEILKLSNIKWLKVHQCQELPSTQEVFDFTVIPHSNLITDGFISHNSYATDLLSNGADVRQVQQLLGHASITTTQVYTHFTDVQLRGVHERFHRKKHKD